MADKKKAGSALLKALGKTKKEQMKVLYPKAKPKAYPKVKGDVRGKGPYLRGTTGKKGAGDFLKRREAVRGTDIKKALRTAEKEAAGFTAAIGAAAAAGFGAGRYSKSKKTKAKETPSHRDKARRMAQEGIKKQKAKKEKHHSR